MCVFQNCGFQWNNKLACDDIIRNITIQFSQNVFISQPHILEYWTLVEQSISHITTKSVKLTLHCFIALLFSTFTARWRHLHGRAPGWRRDSLHGGAHPLGQRRPAADLPERTAAEDAAGRYHPGGVQERLRPGAADGGEDAAGGGGGAALAAYQHLLHLLRRPRCTQVRSSSFSSQPSASSYLSHSYSSLLYSTSSSFLLCFLSSTSCSPHFFSSSSISPSISPPFSPHLPLLLSLIFLTVLLLLHLLPILPLFFLFLLLNVLFLLIFLLRLSLSSSSHSSTSSHPSVSSLSSFSFFFPSPTSSPSHPPFSPHSPPSFPPFCPHPSELVSLCCPAGGRQ